MQNRGESIGSMTTLVNVTNAAIKRGYTENFRMHNDGLYAPSTEISYLPNEVIIENFYRFEGQSAPEDNAILYLIETHDGIQGILIDSYGAEADITTADFIRNVAEIHKSEAES